MTNVSTLIFTCDNNRDISQYVLETAKKLSDLTKVYLVCESFQMQNDLVANLQVGKQCSFKQKMIEVLRQVEDEYVFILLDDYYLTKSVDKQWNCYMKVLETYRPDYLKICKDYRARSRTKRISKEVYISKKPDRYDVNFHPSIWKKETLLFCLLENCKDDIRHIESFFSKYMRESKRNVFYINKYFLPYVELIVCGKFFRKPFKQYLKPTYEGNRKTCTLLFEIDYKVKKFISQRLPKKFLSAIKRIFFKNKEFYSE